jgi:integrase
MKSPFIMLDPRRELTSDPEYGKFHVKIKASFTVGPKGSERKWKPKRAKTFVYLTEKEFDLMMGKRCPPRLEDTLKIVNEKLRKAETICRIPGITGDQYIQLMDSAGNFESIVGMFDYSIGECLKEDVRGEARDGNAMFLTDARNFFVRFKESEHISYAEITPAWLDKCKTWALTDIKDEKGVIIKKKVSITTFFMYCRALRAQLRLAHKPFNKITEESIPFGSKKEGKFPIPSSNKKKRKIKLEIQTEELLKQRDKILTYVPGPVFASAGMYLNYWKIAYFGNGANMADVLRWKIQDYYVAESRILFERKKTENTEEDNGVIEVFVGPELTELIQIERNKSVDPDEYLFPILKKGMSSAQRKKAVKDFIRRMNRSLKRIARDMGLTIKLTSSSSRYLISTILERAGIPRSATKEMFGHSSEEMQDHYSSPYLIELRNKINGLLSVSK